MFCSCDSSHQYYYKDSVNVHLKTIGEHNGIDIATRKQEIYQKLNVTIENLNKAKMEILSRSNELIHIIKIFTKSKLFRIKKYIDCCNDCFKNKELDTENILKTIKVLKQEKNILILL